MLSKYSIIKDKKYLKAKKWQSNLYFLIDIRLHVNELNLKLLKKKEMLICSLANLAKQAQNFVLKLKLFRVQNNEINFTHFLT